MQSHCSFNWRIIDMELIARVECLERQARYWRAATLIMLIGSLVVLPWKVGLPSSSASKKPGAVLKAPFRVVDDQGRTLMLIDTHVVTDEGVKVTVPRLRLYGIHGKPAFEIEGEYEGGSLQINGRDGRAIAGLAVGSDGPGMYISNDLHPGLVTLTNDALTFTQKGGNGDTTLSATPSGSSLTMYGQNLEAAAQLSRDAKGGHLRLTDKVRRIEHSLP